MTPAVLLVWLGSSTAFAQVIIPPKIYVTSPTGVNIADATFTYSVTDLSIGPLVLTRYYIGSYTREPNRMFFGTNTSHNFDIWASKDFRRPREYTSTVHLGTAASGKYNLAATAAYPANRDAQSGAMTISDGNRIYTDQKGVIYSFSASVPAQGTIYPESQRVISIRFPEGRVQDFLYNSAGQLKAVSDSSGYAFVFDYSASGNVSAACGFNLSQTHVSVSSTCAGAGLKVTYGYSGNLLTEATDVLGRTTTYGWSSGLSCVTPPGYSGCKISNTYAGDKLSQQTLADGSIWRYSSEAEPGITTDAGAIVTNGGINAGFTDPDGKTTSFTFTQSTPYTMTDPNGRTTSYRYTGAKDFADIHTPNTLSEGSLLIEAGYPEGNKYRATYDGGNRRTSETVTAKPGSGLPNLVVEYGYDYAGSTPQNASKPIWIRDPKGNQTDYTYAPWGGTLSEMQPAPNSGAARPLKLYTYVQKYAYVKDAGGGLVPTAAPIWLPQTETLCQTLPGSSVATCDTAASIVITTHEYGADGTANNLLPRGVVVSSGGTSLRTCYGYDNSGNRIFETKPRASLASCS